jgi:TrkA domain protein
MASPRPDFLFRDGDIVVVVGTADGTAAVAEILADG